MSVGLLDFFILEASECVEQIDGLLARASGSTPELAAFARNARALRGSATMAKVPGIAEVAGGLERIAKGLHDGSISWSETLRAAVIAAVDDLKILIRGARTWGTSEERRAADRAAELTIVAPPPARRSAAFPLHAGGSAGFLAAETADVAAGLQRYAERPGPIAAFEGTLGRLRALRGVAALKDLPPLAEVVDTVESAVKSLELGAAAPTDAQRELFRAAAAVLREGSDAIHAGGRPNPQSAAVTAFAGAAERLVAAAGDTDEIVPIASLFPDGPGPYLVSASTNPPTSLTHRFRLEVVSQAEHLRRLVSDARSATDAPSRQRLGHELRGAVRALGRAAESFGEAAVAMTLQALIEGASMLEGRALAALDEAASILTAPVDTPLAQRFEGLLSAGPRASTPGFAAARSSSTPPAPRITTRVSTPLATPSLRRTVATPVFAAPVEADPPQPAPVIDRRTPWAPVAAAPSGAALDSMLTQSLAGLAGLEREPLSEPLEVEDDGVVPIQDLVYRGRSALHRAVLIGDTLKRAGGTPDAESLGELFDLLELATTE
jgi:hypothetical protein